MNRPDKVVVGFSGGKDSTTSIILLKESGYEVSALTMLLGLHDEEEKLVRIRKLTEILKVPLHIIDVREEFRLRVIEYFLNSYADGITPNPCAVCNVRIKFDILMGYGLKTLGGSFFATGHYADKTEIDGKFFLKEPADRVKSQIYFLSMIGGEKLKNVIFPISSIDAAGVREIVKDLPLGNRRESQDVCFLNSLKLNEFLRKRIPDAFAPGFILDIDGNRIGEHKGAVNFTIGQRRGTGFASSGKLYVVKKDIKNNTITLGSEENLFSDELKILNPVIWKDVNSGERYKARIRYMSTLSDVVVIDSSEGLLKIKFDSPVKSVTSGQVCALYEKDIIVASGFVK